MRVLTATEGRSRRCLDGSVVLEMQNAAFSIRGAITPRDAREGRFLDDAAVRGGEATAYVATYRFPMLQRNGRTLPEARILFDVSHTEYPFRTPDAYVMSQPLPWGAHVAAVSGVICLGPGWRRSEGAMLLGDLAVHTMRLLNWDEPKSAGLDGYDASAFEAWSRRGCRPLNPDLEYPTLPDHVAFGTPNEVPMFRAVASTTRPVSTFRRLS